MRRKQQNNWKLIAVTAAVILGLLLGGWIQGGSHRAEAVIGGIGNVTVSDHPHNFAYSSSGAKTSDFTEERVCVFCHTPHQSDSTAAILNAPLWNHTLSTGVIYSLKTPGFYTGSGVSGNVALVATPLSTPDGDSRLCLSCHDGTVSVGDVGSESAGISMASSTCIDTSTPPYGKMYSNSGSCKAFIGSNLTKMHVVSIPMNAGLISAHNSNCGTVTGQTTKLSYPFDTTNNNSALPDTVFLRPTTATYGGASGIDGASIRGTTGCNGDLQCEKNYGDSYSYGIQCSTCHDPHYWASGASSNTEGYKMLVAGVSNLCSACHYIPSAQTPPQTCP